MRDTVLDKATRLENEGWKQYTYQQNAVTFTAKLPPKTAVESDKAANTLFKLAK